MDAYDVTRMVYTRVQAFEPDHASKIMGYLLLQDDGEQEMFRLAFSHESVLHSIVLKVKKELGLTSPTSAPHRNPSHSPSAAAAQHYLSSTARLPPQFSQSMSHELPSSLHGIEHLNRSFHGHEDIRPNDLSLRSSDNLSAARYVNRMGLTDQDRFSERLRSDMQIADQQSFINDTNDAAFITNGFLYQDNGYGDKLDSELFQGRYNCRQYPANDLAFHSDLISPGAWKPCLYYARGFCKHGTSCKFLHSGMRPDSSFLLSPSNGQIDSGSDDGIITGSLDRLEYEIQELLRSRKVPISIASLPQMYYERYGKTLQADGYLTESQRHGKAGYSLTKLLARLKNSVTLIDSVRRPHGQHAVVLAEDAFKFTAFRGDKDDSIAVNPGSRQIYLTFPADSAFSEEDVSAYFRGYGPVQDVRIPYQQKRMFGFVTFVYAETVKMILGKGNPHYICGARVLVKPYKEKGKHSDRKLTERDLNRFLPGNPLDSLSAPRFFLEQQGALRRQLEEQEMIVEMERKRLAELHLEKQKLQNQFFTPSDVSSPSTSSIHAGNVAVSEPASLRSNGFGRVADYCEDVKSIQSLVDSDSYGIPNDSNGTKEEPAKLLEKEAIDKQSDEHNLPDSPFTSPHKLALKVNSDNSILENSPKVCPAAAVAAVPPGFAMSSGVSDNVNCRICRDFYIDPVQLDCGHCFCEQCILKVIRVSKDECPVCQQHIGSQIVKLLDTRRLQVVDMW